MFHAAASQLQFPNKSFSDAKWNGCLPFNVRQSRATICTVSALKYSSFSLIYFLLLFCFVSLSFATLRLMVHLLTHFVRVYIHTYINDMPQLVPKMLHASSSVYLSIFLMNFSYFRNEIFIWVTSYFINQ